MTEDSSLQGSATPDLCPRVVCIGNFDGVHRGHRALISLGRVLAKDLQVERLAALSFWPHPTHFFRPNQATRLLSLPKQRAQQLRVAGVDEALFVPFDQRVADLEPAAFVEEFLIQGLQAKGVVVGQEFRFGAKRRGSTEELKAFLKAHGAELRTIEPIPCRDGTKISSSRIRADLESGNFAQAMDLMGHGYELVGTVIRGAQRGRTLGYPTANLDIDPQKLLPAHGVYAARSFLGGQAYFAVVNVGRLPTFGGQENATVEAHILHAPVDLDLYGQELSVSLEHFIRTERRFETAEALQAQIADDLRQAQLLLEP